MDGRTRSALNTTKRPARTATTGTTPAPAPGLVLDGLAQRLMEVPIPAGNYEALSANSTRLFWLTRQTTVEHPAALQALDIGNTDVTPKTLVDDVRSFELSGDGKKLLVRKGNALDVIDATSGANASLDKAAVNLSGRTFALDPREAWRQLFDEAWQHERRHFYHPLSHGRDRTAVRANAPPRVQRDA